MLRKYQQGAVDSVLDNIRKWNRLLCLIMATWVKIKKICFLK